MFLPHCLVARVDVEREGPRDEAATASHTRAFEAQPLSSLACTLSSTLAAWCDPEARAVPCRLLMHPHALHFTKASWIPAPGCCATDNFACRLHHFTEWLADPSFSDTEPEPGDKGEMVWAAPPGRWWRLALPMHPCPGPLPALRPLPHHNNQTPPPTGPSEISPSRVSSVRCGAALHASERPAAAVDSR